MSNEKVIKGEVDHCRHRLIKYCKGQGLDLGCGRSQIRVDAIGIDLYYPEADLKMDARLLPEFPGNHFDYVFSSHLLEEIEDTEAILREWLRILKPTGNIVLYQADINTYYQLGDPRCNRSHKHHFSKETLSEVFKKIGGVKLIHAKDPQGDEWSFELVIKKLPPNSDINIEEDINTENLNFKFMIVGGPAEAYIEKCLQSVQDQKYSNWSAQVVLDPFEDGTYEKAKKFENEKIKVVLNDSRQNNIANFFKASSLLNPQDDDVLIMLDADDWLAGPNVLTTVKEYYDLNQDLLVTHGSWVAFPRPNVTNNLPYSEQDFMIGVRKVMWRASHLKTFKYKVWKHIKEEDLKDAEGKFYTVSGDLALMYPMLEMAGYSRVQFIPEVLHVYNQESPFNDEKLRKEKQLQVGIEIQNREPYRLKAHFNENPKLNLLIFSKDRSCQLDLLLRSVKNNLSLWETYNIKILYTFSTPEYEKGYNILKGIHPEFKYIKETSFKNNVLENIDVTNEYTMFGVDDNILLNTFSLDCPEVNNFYINKTIACLSLRMHPRMNFCYVQNTNVEIPNFEKNNMWKWPGLRGDWGYPMSQDFHLFRTDEIIKSLRSLDYNNPNSLEDKWAATSGQLGKPYMTCFEQAKVVNIPANKVQTHNNNRHGNQSQEFLNQKFLDGERIILPTEIPNHFAPHVEYDYQWERN